MMDRIALTNQRHGLGEIVAKDYRLSFTKRHVQDGGIGRFDLGIQVDPRDFAGAFRQ